MTEQERVREKGEAWESTRDHESMRENERA